LRRDICNYARREQGASTRSMNAMAQAERIRSASTNEFFQLGAKRFESLMEVHKELLDTFERVQRDRLARAMEETKLASEFAAKVAVARSIPDIMAIYQDWMTKCAQMFDEDRRKFLDDSQKVANAALSLLSNGQGNGST
jgi:ribosome-binding protein aMBF1 (putative translation factor)